MRTVAAEAQVNLASIVYYFESKEGLYFAVFDRYAEGILGVRREAIEKIDSNPSLEGYIRSFMEPAFMVISDPQYGGQEFASLLWRLPHEPQSIQDKIKPKYITPLYAMYASKLRVLYPDITDVEIQSFLHIARSLFFSTLGRNAGTNIWPCESWDDDYEVVLTQIVKALCSALEAIVNKD